MENNKQKYVNIITDQLTWFQMLIHNKSRANLLDCAVLAEGFLAEFLNVLYGWHLENLNSYAQYAKGVDLISIKDKIVIQVTADNSRGKILESLRKTDCSDYEGYQFIICIIGEKKKYEKFKDKLTYIKFNDKEDIWDISTLVNKLGTIEIIDHLEQLYSLTNKYYGETKKRIDRETNTKALFESLREKCVEWRKVKKEEKRPQLYKELIAPVEVEGYSKPFVDLSKAVLEVTQQCEKTTLISLTAKGGQGKSTQMLSLWETLENHKNAENIYDCIVFFFDLNAIKDVQNIMDKIQEKYTLSDDEIAILETDMRALPGESKYHYFLLLDGLDEVPSESPIIEYIKKHCMSDNKYSNLQMIIAGRSEASFVLGDETRINMILKDLDPKKVKKWMADMHPGECIEEEYESLQGNPMLLILAYETDPNLLRKYKHIQYVERKPNTPLRQGEVLWNCTEHLLYKYCDKRGINTEEDKDHVRYLLYEVIPYIAYHYFFAVNSMSGIGQYTLKRVLQRFRVNNTEKALKLFRETFSSVIHKSDDLYLFEHRLFRDYFAMLYLGQLFKKACDGIELSPEEIKIFGDEGILDNPEYSELLVCIIPFLFEFTNDYELQFLNMLKTEVLSSGPSVMSEQGVQVARFLRAIYALWLTRHYLLTKHKNQEEITLIAQEIFYGLQDVANILDNPDESILLPDNCYSYALYILSQTYRTGSVFINSIKETALPGFRSDLNKSFDYAYKAIDFDLNITHTKVVDGYNYIAKIFTAANEKISNHFTVSTENYEIKPDDLIVDFQDISISGYRFCDHISESVAKKKVGDYLTVEEAKERIQCFNDIIADFYNMGVQNECVFSMNNLARLDERAQMLKPEKERDYTYALDMFIKASKLPRVASFYSAAKAAEILACGKAGINANGDICTPDQTDKTQTAKKAYALLAKAVRNKERWGHKYYCRGLLKLNYLRDENRVMTPEKAIEEAYDDFSLAFFQYKYIRVSLLVKLVETGLELIKKNIKTPAEIKRTMRIALNGFINEITVIKNNNTKDQNAEKKALPVIIASECLSKMKKCAVKYEKEIELLSLSAIMEKCISEVL